MGMLTDPVVMPLGRAQIGPAVRSHSMGEALDGGEGQCCMVGTWNILRIRFVSHRWCEAKHNEIVYRFLLC